jgi:hypothetical protein
MRGAWLYLLVVVVVVVVVAIIVCVVAYSPYCREPALERHAEVEELQAYNIFRIPRAGREVVLEASSGLIGHEEGRNAVMVCEGDEGMGATRRAGNGV